MTFIMADQQDFDLVKKTWLNHLMHVYCKLRKSVYVYCSLILILKVVFNSVFAKDVLVIYTIEKPTRTISFCFI